MYSLLRELHKKITIAKGKKSGLVLIIIFYDAVYLITQYINSKRKFHFF